MGGKKFLSVGLSAWTSPNISPPVCIREETPRMSNLN